MSDSIFSFWYSGCVEGGWRIRIGVSEEVDETNPVADLEELQGLPEESSLIFSSSDKQLTLPSESSVSSSARVLAIVLMIAAVSGLYNGWDYTQPDQGLVRPHEWVWQMGMSAPNGSATLSGIITTDDGQPAMNHTVLISMTPSTSSATENWVAQALTESDGSFRLENLSSGMVAIEVYAPHNEGPIKGMVHRLLLSPPPMFIEPIGFTHIEIAMPSDAEHEAAFAESGNKTYRVDYRPSEMEQPLLDPGAIGVYVMLGFFFLGISFLSLVFAILGFNSGSRGQLRISSILVFFSVGFLWSSCCLGSVGFGLTFAIPKREV